MGLRAFSKETEVEAAFGDASSFSARQICGLAASTALVFVKKRDEM